MAPEPHGRRIPDVLLERYLADDLPTPERTRIQAALVVDDAVRQRLDELQRERLAFLAENPAAAFAHRLAVRLDVDADESRPARRRSWWLWALGPSIAAATTLLVLITVVQNTPEATVTTTVGQVAAPAALGPSVPVAADPVAEPAGAKSAETRGFAKPPPARLGSGRVAREASQPADTTTDDAKDASHVRAKARAPRAKPVQVSGKRGTESQDLDVWEEGASRQPAAPMAAPAATAPAPSVDGEPRERRQGPTEKAEAKSAAAADRAPSSVAKQDRNVVGEVVGGDASPGFAGTEPLSKEEIAAVVRTNARTLTPCLTAAQQRGELASGKHALALSWVVRSDGTVTGAALTGPSALAKTGFAKCIAKQLSGWRFRASGQTLSVREFSVAVVAP